MRIASNMQEENVNRSTPWSPFTVQVNKMWLLLHAFAVWSFQRAGLCASLYCVGFPIASVWLVLQCQTKNLLLLQISPQSIEDFSGMLIRPVTDSLSVDLHNKETTNDLLSHRWASSLNSSRFAGNVPPSCSVPHDFSWDPSTCAD